MPVLLSFIGYIIKRIIRRTMPKVLVRQIKKRGFLIGSGLETTSPVQAAMKYIEALEQEGHKVQGANVMIYGYGGCLGTSIELVKIGAKHVYLYDKFAALDDFRNIQLLRTDEKYIKMEMGKVRPNPSFVTIIEGDLNDFIKTHKDLKFDIILSNDVFEHIRGELIAATIELLAQRMQNDGINMHIINLRDHVNNCPYHMLCFSELLWSRLVAENHLNRWRLIDYVTCFEKKFKRVYYKIIEMDMPNFRRMEKYIRPEFKTGQEQLDAISRVVLIAE